MQKKILLVLQIRDTLSRSKSCIGRKVLTTSPLFPSTQTLSHSDMLLPHHQEEKIGLHLEVQRKSLGKWACEQVEIQLYFTHHAMPFTRLRGTIAPTIYTVGTVLAQRGPPCNSSTQRKSSFLFCTKASCSQWCLYLSHQCSDVDL